MIELVKKNIIETLKFSKLIFVGYLLLLICTFFFGYSVYASIKGGLSSSLEALKLINGFDRTVVDDWMNSYKDWSKLINKSIIISALIYIIFAIFNSGGLIGSIVNKRKELQQYVKYGIKNLLPFTGFSLFFLILFSIINGSLVFIYLKILGHPIDNYETEKPFFYSAMLMIVLVVFITGFLWTWSMLSKINYVNENGFFKAIGMGFSIIRKNYFRYLLGFIGFIALSLPAFYLFGVIHETSNASSFKTIILALIAMQLTVIYRVFLKSGMLVWLNDDLQSQR